ncbi:pentapeptide repeat-containing protein [Streptosporangium sp. NPDC005286]|uniref:pentapeptide repeat-containing protein n=1 Tax=Streptosporangium sp. NPDC005286 TaxID=3154463 RepID=UPI0033A26CF2
MFNGSGNGGDGLIVVIAVCMAYIYMNRNARLRVRRTIRTAAFMVIALEGWASSQGHSISALILDSLPSLRSQGPESAVIAGLAMLGLAIALGRGKFMHWRRSAIITAPTPGEVEAALTPKERIELLTSQRQTILGAVTSIGVIVGLILTGSGLIYTSRTLEATKDAQITDRYSRAIDQLGSPSAQQRVGALYALERLAADSPRDTSRIETVVTSFITDWSGVRTTSSPSAAALPSAVTRPGADLLAALNALRGIRSTDEEERYKQNGLDYDQAADVTLDINFHGADLRQVDLRGAYLVGVDLSRADLRGTDLGGADLRHSSLISTLLNQANLEEANLTEADLSSASLRGVKANKANFSQANLSQVELDGASLKGAKMTGIRGKVRAEIEAKATVNRETTW